MAELSTIRNYSNGIVSAGNDINSALSSFNWSKSYDCVNGVAREIDNLQRAVAKLAEVRRSDQLSLAMPRPAHCPSAPGLHSFSSLTQSCFLLLPYLLSRTAATW